MNDNKMPGETEPTIGINTEIVEGKSDKLSFELIGNLSEQLKSGNQKIIGGDIINMDEHTYANFFKQTKQETVELRSGKEDEKTKKIDEIRQKAFRTLGLILTGGVPFVVASCAKDSVVEVAPTPDIESGEVIPVEVPETEALNSSEKETQDIKEKVEESMEAPDSEEKEETPIPEENTEEGDSAIAEELKVNNAFTEEEFNKFLPYSIQYYINKYRTDGEPFLTFIFDPSTGTSIRRSYVAPYGFQNGEFASGLENHIYNDPDADLMVDAYSEQYVKYVDGERTKNWDPDEKYNQFFLLMKAEDEYGEYNYVVPIEGGFFRVQSKLTYSPTNEVNGVPTRKVQYIPLSEINTLTPQEREWYDNGYMIADYRFGNGIPRGPWFSLKGIVRENK